MTTGAVRWGRCLYAMRRSCGDQALLAVKGGRSRYSKVCQLYANAVVELATIRLRSGCGLTIRT